MFRKIFIFLLIGVSLQKTEVEATGDLLSGFLATPLNLASRALSLAGGVVHNVFDVTNILTNAAIYNVNAMANNILECSHKLALNVLGGIDAALSILQNASSGIGLALSRFYESISIAREQFLDRLINMEKNLVHGCMEDGKQFILRLIQSGQIILGTTKQKYEDVIKNITNLAEDLKNEFNNNKDETKAVAVEAIAEQIKKLENDFTELCEHFSDVAKNATDDLNSLNETELIENKIKDITAALTNVWSKANKNIEDMRQQFEKLFEVSGDVAEDIKLKFDNCRKQFEEINKDLRDFVQNVKTSAHKTINDIVNKSKTGLGMFFNSSMDALSNSVSGVENIVGSTIELIGDFMKDRMKSITKAKQLVVDTLNNMNKATGDTLHKLTDIVQDFTFKVETTSSGILEITLNRFIQIMMTVDEAIKKGGNSIRSATNQTMDLVFKAKTEICAAINDDIKHIQSTYKSATEKIKNIATGVADILKNTTKNIRNLCAETISAAQASIAKKISIFMSIVDHGVNGSRRLARHISNTLRKFQNGLHTVLANVKNETQLKISQGIKTIKNLSDEFLGHLQKKYIQGSKKYLECSKEARNNLQDTMPNLMEKVHSCGREGITSVVQTIDAALDLEHGITPKVEQLLNSYEQCRREKVFGLTCTIKIPVDKILGLPQTLVDVMQGTVEAAANMASCNAQYITDSKIYFAKLREEFDNCIKQE